jgi:hypothetical protein
VQSSDGEKWIYFIGSWPKQMGEVVGEKPLIIAISALTAEEWQEVLDAAEPDDLPKLRRLRKLAVHRNWRLKHRDEESERHRTFYETKRKPKAKAKPDG